jgi:hypothetical protein
MAARMSELGKWLIVTGAGTAVIGLISSLRESWCHSAGGEANVTIEQKNYTVCFPIATCIILLMFISLVV